MHTHPGDFCEKENAGVKESDEGMICLYRVALI